MIHLEKVGPDKAPGGLWVRLCTREELLTEYALTDPGMAGLSASVDAELSKRALERGSIWLYFYDGDSGECLGTVIG